MSNEGRTNVNLTSQQLDVNAALSSVRSPECGAVSIFLGSTRADIIDGKEVVALKYEAYDDMALKTLRTLCDEVRQIHPVKHLYVSHRLGIVKVEEDSILIISSGEHRQESMKATEWLINKIKSRVPVWKKEIFADGGEVWKENKETFWRC